MLHNNAWAGGLIVVVHTDTKVTSNIEESISRFDPSIEPYICTFNDAREAVEFCKSRVDIRLFLIGDQVGQISGIALFDNICNSVSSTITTPQGILLYSSTPKIETYKTLSKRSNPFDYISVDSLLGDETKVKKTLSQIWNDYVSRIETNLLPDETAELLVDLCEDHFDPAFRSKYERVTNIVTSQLNLSYNDVILIKWMPYIHYLLNRHTKPAHPQSQLFKLYSQIESSKEGETSRIETLKDYSLKLSSLATSSNEDAQKYLLELKKNLRPSSPAILRVIARNSERIAAILANSDSNYNSSEGAA